MQKPVTDPNKANVELHARKPYHAPVLTVYGTLGALTRSAGASGLSDGMGGAGMTSTSP
jgi:hypothetical protein